MGCKMTVIVALCGADEGFKVAKCIVFEISLVLCLPKYTLSRSGSGSGSGTLNTTVIIIVINQYINPLVRAHKIK